MAHPILPMMVVYAVVSAHPVDLNAKSKDPISLCKANPDMILIAERRASPADGDDPHGDDPHDETRNRPYPDKSLPAKGHKDDYKAPQDPYGGEYPQGKGPNW